MDSGGNAPREQDTEPFPDITPVPSAPALLNTYDQPSPPSAAAAATTTTTTTTTTTAATTPHAGRPTATTTPRQAAPRPPPQASHGLTRPHSLSSPGYHPSRFLASPASARPQSTASPAPLSGPGAPSSQTQSAQPHVRRKPVGSSPPPRRPSVRLRRASSLRSIETVASDGSAPSRPASYGLQAAAGPSASRPTSYALADINEDVLDAVEASRRRSASEPQRPAWVLTEGQQLARSTAAQQQPPLASVREEGHGQQGAPLGASADSSNMLAVPQHNAGMLRRLSVGARNAVKRRSQASHEQAEELDPALVDILDVVDPEVATLSTLTNVQNSLFIPDLGPLVNRQPTYTLSRRPAPKRSSSLRVSTGMPPPPQSDEEKSSSEADDSDVDAAQPQLTHTTTISSVLTDSHYAVLPHGKSLDGWTEAEKEQLNDYVRHMLHSKRSAFKRGLKGFVQYVRRPLGFFVTLYAVLITLFGAAWVLFLIGWINLGSRRLYIINVIDNVLVALFAIMGDGLAPFRAWDTYNTIFVLYYWRLTRKLRKKQNLPKLKNKNDLPTQIVAGGRKASDTDLEMQDSPMMKDGKDEEDRRRDDDPEGFGTGRPDEYSVLTPKQQASLELHQRRLARSHTFYKPHETLTHHPFPISYLLTIVILCDMHSCLQIALGACTWSISYHVRPFALTTVILCLSITCNISAGIFIMIGDRKTRKKDVLEKMFRQQLTAEAMKKVQKRRIKTMEREQRDGLMGSAIHDDEGRYGSRPSAGDSGVATPGRRSTDRLRSSLDRLRGVPMSTPGGGSANQSTSSLKQVPSVPGVKIDLVP